MMGEILTQLNQIPSCSAFGASLSKSCWTDFVYFLTLACPLSCMKILSRWRGIVNLTCRLRGGAKFISPVGSVVAYNHPSASFR